MRRAAFQPRGCRRGRDAVSSRRERIDFALRAGPKYFSEAVLADVAHAEPNLIGCEPSGTLGEDPRHEPTNLFSVIAQVFKGERAALDVFGSECVTCDIHVVDLARDHLAALAAAGSRPAERAFRTYNQGAGTGSQRRSFPAWRDGEGGREVDPSAAERAQDRRCGILRGVYRSDGTRAWKTRLSMDKGATGSWRRICHCSQVITPLDGFMRCWRSRYQ